ncbi:hypothetical protein HOY80DRAFT_965081 [Tuber brumale]|nr:hypothetical protein HOY80DRAFT_965081 [Tuber brumale]
MHFFGIQHVYSAPTVGIFILSGLTWRWWHCWQVASLANPFHSRYIPQQFITSGLSISWGMCKRNEEGIYSRWGWRCMFCSRISLVFCVVFPSLLDFSFTASA